jgi:hypothetical protein
MIKLFDVTYLQKQAANKVLSMPTPLGSINLEVVINNSKLSDAQPKISGKISTSACIFGWSLKDIHIELLKVQVEPSLLPTMKISHCIAFLWRFKNLSKKVDLQLSCRCLFKQQTKGEPESGEGLIAQSWDDTNVRITIGTEDEEDLFERAESQQWLPSRLAKENLLTPEMIKYLADGIQVSLPTLLENEQGQIQFVIAWVEGKDRCGYSTWQAVDMSYKKILEFVSSK